MAKMANFYICLTTIKLLLLLFTLNVSSEVKGLNLIDLLAIGIFFSK